MHVAVTTHPTAARTAQQLREAFPCDEAPRYLIRDRDLAFAAVHATAEAMAITQVLTAPRSPWQNGVIERFIGSVRRECLDHVIIFNANGLQRILKSYMEYYERSRTHLALQKDAPVSRPVSPSITGRIIAIPQVHGPHHRYEDRVINSIIHSCERRYSGATALLSEWPLSVVARRQTLFSPDGVTD